MIASTWLDMVVGVDIHFEMVPTPAGPIPTPFPNPFIGLVFDPAGLAVGLALGAAMALATGGTPTGPVLINCMPATNVGTEAKGMGHILIPPGVAWVPMPKFPKPSFRGPPEFPGLPVKPEDDAVSIMGSTTVTIMGSSAVRMGEMWMSCGEPLRMPSSVVIAIPKGPLVLVGGPPGVNLLDALLAMIKTKWVAGYMHSLVSRIKSDRIRNLLSKAVCFLTGHPVDVATGRLLTDNIDFELPGPLPLKFERNYASSWSHRNGPLGPGWSHSLDQAVWFERGKVVYLAEDGRELEFDTFDLPDHALRPGQDVYEPIHQLTLRFKQSDRIEIETHSGETLEFSRLKQRPGSSRDAWWRLQKRRTRDGREIALSYDPNGNLAWVKDSGGRIITFEHDALGRLICVRLPHPTEDGFVDYVRYAYDAEGDLVQVTDALGASWTFAYKRHLMVRETNRNGLSFYFAYDGWNSEAYCVRTWGDGGIYDHVIDYSKGKLTVVTNSLGHQTAYKLNEIGQVVEVVDARGGSTKYEYDERTLKPTREVAADGATTLTAYDSRGNPSQITQPDGSEIALEYDAHNQPVRARDQVGGEWHSDYDSMGRLAAKRNPLGERTQFIWSEHGLRTVVDPRGYETQVTYDTAGNLSTFCMPDGAKHTWSYDRLGRVVSNRDPKGNIQRRARDLLGRVVRCEYPDGNVRELTYDAEGNVVRGRDRVLDVAFEYRGLNRLSTRTQAGTRVEFYYNTEERLCSIRNEHGHAYRFVRGPAGDVDEEWGFGGRRRKYQRDPAGRVTRLVRPGGSSTSFRYDPSGRTTQVQHSDGSHETYTYRADGVLTLAGNDTAVVRIEYDALGRIIKEATGDDWVSCDYESTGLRRGVRSSKGLVQRIRRNSLGDVLGVDAEVQQGAGATVSPGRSESARSAGTFTARFERDQLGLEVERSLPGGVHARWQRDSIGRPLRQEIWRDTQFHSGRQYTWDFNDRLRRLIDSNNGPTEYSNDVRGHLTAATYADGFIDLRMPDAVGNLFRSQTRSDRKYGPSGELLEARVDAGIVKYDYDSDGNLVLKTEPDGRTWSYAWNAAGMLVAVTRPDGRVVQFGYDALARRVFKKYGDITTRWMWDGNVPLHEWVECGSDPACSDAHTLRTGTKIPHKGVYTPKALLSTRPTSGPPNADVHDTAQQEQRTSSPLITWLYEPESFAPLAKLVDDKSYSIVTNHLGTPLAMFDGFGNEVWAAETDAYGNLRNIHGTRSACPFRWPGQYEDEETGLNYNRFRYYDPSAGEYIAPDPLRIYGDLNQYAYVPYPIVWSDPFALAPTMKWGNPLSRPTYGHTFLDHTAKQTATQLADRARSLGHQVGQWTNDRAAAEFIAEIAERGAGVHDVPIPAGMGRSFLEDGTELVTDMARVIVKPDGSVRTAFPYDSSKCS